MLNELQPTLELLIRQEIAVKQLYETFANIFETHEDFWRELAKSEQNHADLLSRLRTRNDIEIWLIDEMRLSPEVVKRSTAYVKEKEKLTLQGEVDLQQAFSLAENIERFLIDGVFSKLDERPMATIPRAMLTLAEETKEHREMVLQKQRVLFRK